LCYSGVIYNLSSREDAGQQSPSVDSRSRPNADDEFLLTERRQKTRPPYSSEVNATKASYELDDEIPF
jgi:hypothetical protein